MPSQHPYMRWQHNKRSASGTPSMANMNNNAMMAILKCKQDILSDLKRAFREQMQNHIVNGKPFLGQLPSEVDASGQIRETLWENVAKSDKKLRDILNGKRYGSEKPINFDANVAAVKNKICSDHTNERRKKKGTATSMPEKEVVVAGSARQEGSGDEGSDVPAPILTSRSVDRNEHMLESSGGEAVRRPFEAAPSMQVQQSIGAKRPALSSWRTYPTKRPRAVPTAPVHNSPLRTVVNGCKEEDEQVSVPALTVAGSSYAPAATMQASNRNASEENAIPTIERESQGLLPFGMTAGIESLIGRAEYNTYPRASDTPDLAMDTFDSPEAHHGSEIGAEVKVEQRATDPPASSRGDDDYNDYAPQVPAEPMQRDNRTGSSSSESVPAQYRPTKVSFFGKRTAMDNNVRMNNTGDDTARKQMPPPRFTSHRKTIVADDVDDDDEDDNNDNEDLHGFRAQTSRSSTGLFVSEVNHRKDSASSAKEKPSALRQTFDRPAGVGSQPLSEIEGMQTTVAGLSLPPSEGRMSHGDAPSMRSSSMRDSSGAPSVKTPPPPREISESVASVIEVARAPANEPASARNVNASETGTRSPDASPEPGAEASPVDDEPAATLQTTTQPHNYPTRFRATAFGKTKTANTTLLSPSLTGSDYTTSPAQPAAVEPANNNNNNRKDDKLGDAMKTMIAYQVSNMAEKLSKDFDKKSKEMEARLVAYVDQRLEDVAKEIGKDGDEELKERIRSEILKEIREGFVGE